MTVYETGKRLITDMLTGYRDMPADTKARIFVNQFMEKSRDSAGDELEEKKLHNLIVLRYLTETPLPKKRLCDTLHLSRTGGHLDSMTDKAIDRLLLLCFGLPNWDAQWATNKDYCNRPNCSRVYNTAEYNTTTLLIKNYRWLNKCFQVPLLETCAGNAPHTKAWESIRRNYAETAFIMSRLNELLGVYKSMCACSSIAEDLRRWRILERMYLTDEHPRPEEIIASECICRSKLYDDTRMCISDLTVMLFGVGGIVFPIQSEAFSFVSG